MKEHVELPPKKFPHYKQWIDFFNGHITEQPKTHSLVSISISWLLMDLVFRQRCSIRYASWEMRHCFLEVLAKLPSLPPKTVQSTPMKKMPKNEKLPHPVESKKMTVFIVCCLFFYSLARENQAYSLGFCAFIWLADLSKKTKGKKEETPLPKETAQPEVLEKKEETPLPKETAQPEVLEKKEETPLPKETAQPETTKKEKRRRKKEKKVSEHKLVCSLCSIVFTSRQVIPSSQFIVLIPLPVFHFSLVVTKMSPSSKHIPITTTTESSSNIGFSGEPTSVPITSEQKSAQTIPVTCTVARATDGYEFRMTDIPGAVQSSSTTNPQPDTSVGYRTLSILLHTSRTVMYCLAIYSLSAVTAFILHRH